MKTTLTYSCGDADEGKKYIQFDYEVENEEVEKCIVYLFMNEFDIDKYNSAELIISEFEMWDDLFERYEDDIYDNFSNDAWEYYENKNKDAYSFYGISENDFH